MTAASLNQIQQTLTESEARILMAEQPLTTSEATCCENVCADQAWRNLIQAAHTWACDHMDQFEKVQFETPLGHSVLHFEQTGCSSHIFLCHHTTGRSHVMLQKDQWHTSKQVRDSAWRWHMLQEAAIQDQVQHTQMMNQKEQGE